MGIALPRSARRPSAAALAVVSAVLGTGVADGREAAPTSARMVQVPAGTYRPLYRLPAAAGKRGGSASQVQVAAFEMDELPVTNAEYLEFVRQHPKWQRSRASQLFVDGAYLAHWKGDLQLGEWAPPDSPVVNVSWFAARAYLAASGKELPTVDQWEYVAAASETMRDASRDPAFLERLRIWTARPVPRPLPAVGSGWRNRYGVSDLHGTIWEWTLDFNSALVTGESRADVSLERTLFCGSGAVGAADFENYPAFMRYALRSSLEARYSVGSVGFRGVRNSKRASR